MIWEAPTGVEPHENTAGARELSVAVRLEYNTGPTTPLRIQAPKSGIGYWVREMYGFECISNGLSRRNTHSNRLVESEKKATVFEFELWKECDRFEVWVVKVFVYGTRQPGRV